MEPIATGWEVGEDRRSGKSKLVNAMPIAGKCALTRPHIPAVVVMFMYARACCPSRLGVGGHAMVIAAISPIAPPPLPAGARDPHSFLGDVRCAPMDPRQQSRYAGAIAGERARKHANSTDRRMRLHRLGGGAPRARRDRP